MAKQKRSPASALVSAFSLAALLLLLLAPGAGDAVAQKRSSKRRQTTPPKDALALANLYYTSNDVSDLAAKEYRLVRDSYKGTAEAATAQYFLASYYQRKFYIIREKSGWSDTGALLKAAKEYDDYRDDYAKGNSNELLADARFNLALVYMQLGRVDDAVEELSELRDEDASKDGSIYIRQVVWTSNQKDALDGNFSSWELAEFTRGQLQQKRAPEQIISAIKEWCWHNRRK